MVSVIVCAAGSGTRAGLPENKIFYELNGLPVLSHALSALAPFADEMLVACREEDLPRAAALLSPFPRARAIPGGVTRFESVARALALVRGDIVVVHDAARPFVKKEEIAASIESAKAYGSGICAVPVTDTVASVFEGAIADMPPRDALYALQTPQSFRAEELRLAYARAEKAAKTDFTDDSGVYAAYIAPPRIVAGSRENRKLTYPEDFSPAERVGFGVDTHAFAHQEEWDRGIARLNLSYLKLAGVVIPSNRELEAHSDGDVLCHALMDALLTAIGERDIGYHFPENDPAYAGADSMELLKTVVKTVHGAGFSVKNASVSVLCELPRLSPYIDAMRKNLQSVLGCEAVGIAAGTNEKLGYIGEGKGITCYALVLLEKAAAGRDRP